MNLGSRIGQWLVDRFGGAQLPPTSTAAAAGETAPPAQIYVREVPRNRPLSGKALLAVGAVLVVGSGLAWYSVPAPATATTTADLATAGVDKGRIQRIIHDLNRKNADLALQQEEVKPPIQTPVRPALDPGMPQPMPQSSVPTRSDERRERAYKSLFASPVLAVRADSAWQPRSADTAASALAQQTLVNPPPAVKEKPEPPPPYHDCVDLDGAYYRLYAICEGNIIEARLENRLVGDLAGPVNAMVERNVYSQDREHLLIPKGTRLLGRAAMAEGAFQERLSVEFHRMILPDGRGLDLHHAVGLDQAGEIALKDKTNHHIPATVATTVALGSLAAFSQFGTGGYLNGNGLDMYRQSLAMQAGQSGQQILGRNLSRPPTITVREGHPVEIYLNTDIHLPEFTPESNLNSGGAK